jgi:ornithine cyclodeaminase/alanine dehydrogenase-like protein (mu-crystallin family)
MLLLNESNLRAVLSMRDVIDAVESGFRSLALGNVNVPARLKLDLPSNQGILLEMPAYAYLVVPSLGTKIVSVFPNNPSRGLEIVQAMYLLLDGETGVPLSLMDGQFITGIRTAATSAVATKFMSNPGSKRLAVFGAGVQAQFHIQAMVEVAEIREILIVSRTLQKARALADYTIKQNKVGCRIAEADEAAEADLICMCTTSPVPLFNGSLIKPGTHINAVGAFTPATRELDTETVIRARLVIDSESAAGSEAGELLIPLSEGVIDAAHIKANLADVVSGRVAGRESPADITLFKSCGLSIEDLATARLAYERGLGKGIGVSFRPNS